jgi:hypothetical protein
MSDTADEQERRQQLERRQLERSVADRVKDWGELREDDYDFHSWTKDASKNCLQAGAIYEYARESRKVRCLLVLMDPKRPRKDWEIIRSGSIDGRMPEPGEIDTYPVEVSWLPCWFEDLNEHDAERALDGFLYCLTDLADYLADNVSFGELFRTKREEVEKAFGSLNDLARVKSEFRHFLPVDDAVEMATRSEAERATVLESVSAEEKRIICGEPCSEVIAVQIHWRFTDPEIAATMKKLLLALRPRNEKYKPRQPKKGSRRDSIQYALDCLSAMRLASYLPKTSPAPAPGALAAWQSGGSAELKQSAIGVFALVRLGGRGQHIAESNFDNLVSEARKVFKKSFPFGEDAVNAPTLAERVMMKSERVSSQDKV